MDMEIFDIIGRLLAAAVALLLAWLTPKLGAWLSANADSATEAGILRMVRSFTRAAEQLLHDEDPTGEKRNAYVKEQLQKLGIEITDAVLGMIEGCVWEINSDNKKAQTQTAEQTASGEAGDGDE